MGKKSRIKIKKYKRNARGENKWKRKSVITPL